MESTQSQHARLGASNRNGWIPPKERFWLWISLAFAAVILAYGLWTLLQAPGFHTRSFKHTFQNFGSNARIVLFAVLAHYVLKFILQKRLADHWTAVKQLAVSLSRFARKWHTPLAVLTISFIMLHVVGAFLYGIELDFNNISGLAALLVLLPVPISGLFRYRRLDRKWHLRSGLAFAILFFIHAFL